MTDKFEQKYYDDIKHEKLTINEDLTFPVFDDIPVSTKTFIIMTNINVDIKKLYDTLPITDYVVIEKRRGRKKKGETINPNLNVPKGSIISVELGGEIKGVSLKKKKKSIGKRPFFRNSITVIMTTGEFDDTGDNKKINFKISKNGKFQMTGCKHDKHAEDCVKTLWQYIKDDKLVYHFKKENDNKFTAIFIPAMRNIDFSLGIKIDREKLDNFFNKMIPNGEMERMDSTEETEIFSLLETSIGYTGVNIKILSKVPISDLKLKKLTYYGDTWNEKDEYVNYQVYLDTMNEKDQAKKLDKKRHNTFLVFHSGKIIMSSMCAEFAKDTYYQFIDIIKHNYQEFIETLDI